MANLARAGSQNPRIKDYAQAIENPYAIDGSLRPLYRYRDEDEEIVRTPEFMANDLDTVGYLEGDCDDIATFSAALTKAMGYPTRLTGIQSSHGDGTYDHVFSEFLVGSSWFPIDLTVEPGTSYSMTGFMSEVV